MTVAHLVIGGGYIGGALTRELTRLGQRVYVTVRTPRPAAEGMEKAHVILFDTLAGECSPPPVDPGIDALDVYCLLTPTALATVEARQRLFHWLDQLPVRRAVLSSSTGVYGEQSGRVVTAETPLVTATARERRLLEIEQAWLHRPRANVIRFAGLYGPGRIIGLQAVRAGALLPGHPTAWLNLLHRDDAVSLLLACQRSAESGAVELGSDGVPILRQHYYGELARLLSVPTPGFSARPDEESQGKAVDPGSTMQRLGWCPRVRDFRLGLAEALSAAPAE